MKASTKAWLILSCCLIMAGSILTGVALLLGGSFNTLQLSHSILNIDQEVNNLVVGVSDVDVSLLPSPDGTVRVESDMPRDLHISALVKEGVLTITEEDQRSWQDFVGIRIGDPKLTVYLPLEKAFGEIHINTGSGDISLSPEKHAFLSADVVTASGDIEGTAIKASQHIKLKTLSGKIHVTDVATPLCLLESTSGKISASGILADNLRTINRSGSTLLSDAALVITNVYTESGNIKMDNCVSVSLVGSGKSGNIRLYDGAVTGSASLKTSSGNIELEYYMATGDMELTSTSGNITANMVCAMRYETTSHSGNIYAPAPTVDVPICKCQTLSGNIHITEQTEQ